MGLASNYVRFHRHATNVGHELPWPVLCSTSMFIRITNLTLIIFSISFRLNTVNLCRKALNNIVRNQVF